VPPGIASDGKPVVSPPRFWWVKDVAQPTAEVDWKATKRFSEWQSARGSLRQYRGAEVDDRLMKRQKESLLQWESENRPGYSTKDVALEAAATIARPVLKLRGPQQASTPQERGVARYEGSPEDNSRVVTVALRHLGAAKVGFVELKEESTRKLIYDQEPAPSKRSIVFEEVEEGREERDRVVIPARARWAIIFSMQVSGETMKSSPTRLGSLTSALTDFHIHNTLAMAHEFFRALGWQSYGPTETNGLGIYPALAVQAGLGELSRLNRLITPEYGPMVRLGMLLTDLPLVPTSPVDFGVMRFCRDCRICANTCPSRALSVEREPTWQIRGPWNSPGHRAYFEDSIACRNFWSDCGTDCGICFAACPYSQEDRATLHEILKATVSNTPSLNNLIRMGTDLVYPTEPDGRPLKDPDKWWHNTNLPEYGINTMQGSRGL
jgi:epoxyqueuosine reductase